MRETAKILIQFTPKYGEILIGVGNILLSYQENILDNKFAREKIKQYLIAEASKEINMLGICESETFQRIIYTYTGQHVNRVSVKDWHNNEKRVSVLLADFFEKSIWPILVNRYIDTIYSDVDKVTVLISVKKKVYLKIYDEDNPDLFIKEVKDFLKYNHIIVSESDIKEKGEIFLELALPVKPIEKFNF